MTRAAYSLSNSVAFFFSLYIISLSILSLPLLQAAPMLSAEYAPPVCLSVCLKARLMQVLVHVHTAHCIRLHAAHEAEISSSFSLGLIFPVTQMYVRGR